MTAVVMTNIWDTPLYKQMDSMSVLWADLIEDAPSASSLPAHADTGVAEEKPTVLEYGWDFEYPTLSRREHIWNNFPYDVIPLGRGADGADRHAIRLNRMKFDDWRNTRTESFDEAMDYAEISEYRLMRCLQASTYWTVEDPITDKDLCVIRMNFAPRATDTILEAEPAIVATPIVEAGPVALAEDDSVDEWIVATAPKKAVAAMPVPPAPKAASVPLIASKQPLNELRTHFPVCWNKELDVETRTAVYSLSIHGTNLRTMARTAGKDERAYRAEVEVRLMATLKASPAWRVLRAEKPTEYCRLEMA
jgi:hypothetical protein